MEIECAAEGELAVTEASSGTHELAVGERAVVCPADPDLKEVRCRIEGRRGSVDVVVTLPRVWWGLACAEGVPQTRRDVSQTVTRAEFRRLAYAGTEVWIDVPPGLAGVEVGIGGDSGINYPARKEGAGFRCVVPLAHYLDHSQIDQRLFRDAALTARFVGCEIDLVRIAAEPTPGVVDFSVAPGRVPSGDVVAVRWKVENCEGVVVSLAPHIGPVDAEGNCEIRVEQRTVLTLTLSAPGMDDVIEKRVIEVETAASVGMERPVARARTAGGWRRAKGFSKTELVAVPGVELLPLRVDRRRRSMHRVNVVLLERWLNERK